MTEVEKSRFPQRIFSRVRVSRVNLIAMRLERYEGDMQHQRLNLSL